MAIKAKQLATPTHYFYPKFKAGDLCRLKSCRAYPELKGLTVAILRDAEVHENLVGKCWVGYETDLTYRGKVICAHENSLTKIGEVEL
jgi:hypothetical protein